MTQKADVMNYLRTGKALTGLGAWRELKVYRLSEAIRKLRKDDGHEIHCEMLKVGDVRFGSYTLIREASK